MKLLFIQIVRKIILVIKISSLLLRLLILTSAQIFSQSKMMKILQNLGGNFCQRHISGPCFCFPGNFCQRHISGPCFCFPGNFCQRHISGPCFCFPGNFCQRHKDLKYDTDKNYQEILWEYLKCDFCDFLVSKKKPQNYQLMEEHLESTKHNAASVVKVSITDGFFGNRNIHNIFNLP
jgi:hypothetical protein